MLLAPTDLEPETCHFTEDSSFQVVAVGSLTPQMLGGAKVRLVPFMLPYLYYSALCPQHPQLLSSTSLSLILKDCVTCLIASLSLPSPSIILNEFSIHKGHLFISLASWFLEFLVCNDLSPTATTCSHSHLLAPVVISKITDSSI